MIAVLLAEIECRSFWRLPEATVKFALEDKGTVASASQGPPAYSRAPWEYLASASQGPPAYSRAPRVLS